MVKNFFSAAGILLTIAFVALSVILGIRAGVMNDSLWAGIGTGGSGVLGAVLFAVGIKMFNCSGQDTLVGKILFAVSMVGIAVLGVSLMAMMLSDEIAAINIAPTIIHAGLWTGAGLFIAPMVLVAAYAFIKFMIVYVDEHKAFSALTALLAIAIGVGMALVTGDWGDLFAAAGAFLFYWICLCVFVNAWKGVESDEYCKYWRIGFTMIIAFLGCGIIFILSQICAAVPVLQSGLEWIAYHVGVTAMYSMLGYLVLVLLVGAISKTWPRLVSWAR